MREEKEVQPKGWANIPLTHQTPLLRHSLSRVRRYAAIVGCDKAVIHTFDRGIQMLDMMTSLVTETSATASTMPRCGIAAGAPVLTLSGVQPVEFISVGDRVITRNGARTVKAVEISVIRNDHVIRISEGVLGKDRPEADLLVAPNQPILIRDWRAKALAGATQAVVAAAKLADGEYIRKEAQEEIRIVSLRFEGPEVIYVAGLELGCEAASHSA